MQIRQIKNIHSSAQAQLQTYGNKVLAFVSTTSQIASLQSYEYDAIILPTHQLIRTVRSADHCFLKPLFLTEPTQKMVDGLFDENNPHQHFHKIEQIAKGIQAFEGLSMPNNPEDKVLVKLLRYLISRKTSLAPFRDRHSSIGYTYSLLEDFCVESDKLQMIRIMDQFTQQRYFNRSMLDKVNVCHDCSGSYLNFAESCVKCNSLDLKTENLIHHFRCAYIGPESDFQKGNHLQCPKCDKMLNHIGIDYDKPSEVNTCQSCNHTTQETTMTAKCIDCGKSNELDQLITHSIFEYKVTEKGEAKALEDVRSVEYKETLEEKTLQNTIPFTVFKLLSKHEAQKQQLYQHPIFELSIQVDSEISFRLNPNLRQNLLDELAGIIRPYLKTHDLISLSPEGSIEILLIDYPQDLANEMQAALQYNLNKMLCDNQWAKEKAVHSHLKLLQS